MVECHHKNATVALNRSLCINHEKFTPTATFAPSHLEQLGPHTLHELSVAVKTAISAYSKVSSLYHRAENSALTFFCLESSLKCV